MAVINFHNIEFIVDNNTLMDFRFVFPPSIPLSFTKKYNHLIDAIALSFKNHKFSPAFKRKRKELEKEYYAEFMADIISGYRGYVFSDSKVISNYAKEQGTEKIIQKHRIKSQFIEKIIII